MRRGQQSAVEGGGVFAMLIDQTLRGSACSNVRAIVGRRGKSGMVW